MTIKSRRFMPTARFALAALALAVVMAGCDDAGERKQAGADWLTNNHDVPPESGWKMGSIAANSRNEVIINVDLYSAAKANSLDGLSAMDKGEVARLACPRRDSEFWPVAGTDTTVVVQLQSMGETLVRANCRRP